MQFHLFSDLHLEFLETDQLRAEVINELGLEGEVVVLAGDIDTAENLYTTMKVFCDRFSDVVFVAGNHEYYGSSPQRVHKILSKVSRKFPNFHWLNNSSVTIQGQRFVGTTLWWENNIYSNMNARHHLNDFRLIHGYVPWVYRANQKAKKYILAELEPEDVLVTHHAPSDQSITLRYKGHPLSAFYYTDLNDFLLHKKPKLCVHGHVHTKLDYHLLDEVRIVANPSGYPAEGHRVEGFDESFRITF